MTATDHWTPWKPIRPQFPPMLAREPDPAWNDLPSECQPINEMAGDFRADDFDHLTDDPQPDPTPWQVWKWIFCGSVAFWVIVVAAAIAVFGGK